MPVPHFNIKITQRSKGNSAVAGAAYQAGEKLFSEYALDLQNSSVGLVHLQHIRYCDGGVRPDAESRVRFQRHHCRKYPCQRDWPVHAGSQSDANGCRPAVRAFPAIVLHWHHHEDTFNRHFCYRVRAHNRDLLHGEPCADSHGHMGKP